LIRLTHFHLSNNALTGSVPDIGKLSVLKFFRLENNPGVSGVFTPPCSAYLFLSGTPISICGCGSSFNPPSLFPPAGTPDSCLATGAASPLVKRALVFSTNIGTYKYTCNTDSNRNPFGDCLNTMAKICNTVYISGNSTRISQCKDGVNSMTSQMNNFWQNVRKECGQWSYNGFTGSVKSINCYSANQALHKNAFYLAADNTRIMVDSSVTNSINSGLWGNPSLIEILDATTI